MADGKAVGGDSAQRPFPKICAVHSVARVFLWHGPQRPRLSSLSTNRLFLYESRKNFLHWVNLAALLTIPQRTWQRAIPTLSIAEPSPPSLCQRFQCLVFATLPDTLYQQSLLLLPPSSLLLLLTFFPARAVCSLWPTHCGTHPPQSNMSDADAYLSLDHMPSEIIWDIARYLMADATISGFVDVWYLAATCRSMSAALLDDDAMWASHVRASFPEPFCSMHSDPHAFGERWMRVYARLTRLTDQDHSDNNAFPARQETGLIYVPARPCGAPDRSATILPQTVYESALVTKSLLACGRIVDDQLEGYGALCAAQHNTRDDGTRDTGPSSHIPVVLLEGVFRGDRLHGRGILRRERYAPTHDEAHGARKHKRRQAIYMHSQLSPLCRCAECTDTLFVQRGPDGPYKYNRLHSLPPCTHANRVCRISKRGAEVYCCRCAVRWCPECRLKGCRRECVDPARACASCTARLHARAAKHFLARLDGFDGMWDGGMPHGDGKAVFEHGTRYDGPWHRGLPHGRGLVDGVERQWFMGTLLPRARLEYTTENSSSTTAVYEGDVRPRGLSVGSLSSVESVPHFDDANFSSALARLPWKDYARHGHGTMRYANGSVFEGEWSDDARRRGRMSHPGGLVFDGTWEKDGSGAGTVSWPDGRVATDALWDAAGRVQSQ